MVLLKAIKRTFKLQMKRNQLIANKEMHLKFAPIDRLLPTG